MRVRVDGWMRGDMGREGDVEDAGCCVCGAHQGERFDDAGSWVFGIADTLSCAEAE